MSDGPSFQQRQALGNLAEVLTNKNPWVFKNYFKDFFNDWDAIYDSDISDGEYYRALNSFPLNAKRYIIQVVLTAWNLHKDLHTLYETINTLIYLKICGPAEYYLMQITYNFISNFGSKLGDLQYVEIESYRNSEYTIRFWQDDSFMRDTYGIIDLQLHNERQTPLLAIVPWFGLLNNVYHVSDSDEFDDQTINDVTDNYLYPLLTNEFAKKHCPWIQSSCDIDLAEESMNRGILFVLHPEYVDRNGL
ncbi:MAG: hypothetical protein K5893_07010 [Prevotella sp.]|nr:hypothetical protein [Prevotella sp.]